MNQKHIQRTQLYADYFHKTAITLNKIIKKGNGAINRDGVYNG